MSTPGDIRRAPSGGTLALFTALAIGRLTGSAV